ncbi:predicted protein [Histoplasma capsulatum G186AR]|uniref:Uncharacterized protein n=1 Tax=Ajellomyces capsulatus (strain G186AR / H82 / ATCC MYA-2454 / RMSCC 2432) TaxID=447093 RepID=C0NJC8_AJECG|nr:uncharacterized protein HCBG_03258 [Histoplasma capsulatum G186AR]EEH07969.1 predicted protein [Histoplasma capsulatum G186AR]
MYRMSSLQEGRNPVRGYLPHWCDTCSTGMWIITPVEIWALHPGWRTPRRSGINILPCPFQHFFFDNPYTRMHPQYDDGLEKIIQKLDAYLYLDEKGIPQLLNV